jgi:hypothetical protein
MLEQHRLGFQATGAKSPPEQRVVSVAVPADNARAASPDVARRDRAVHFGGELVGRCTPRQVILTHLDGTSELTIQVHNA